MSCLKISIIGSLNLKLRGFLEGRKEGRTGRSKRGRKEGRSNSDVVGRKSIELGII